MKARKTRKIISKLIQIPLRFHHQDVHEELEKLREDLARIEGILLALKTQKEEDLNKKIQ